MLKTKKQKWVLILSVAVLALLLGMWSRHNFQLPTVSPKQMTVATLFNQPRTISDFKLIDGDEKPFTRENFKGHYSLLFFGFTNCPDLCPTTLSTLNQAYQQLQKDKVENMPQVVFISVDPEQDTPARIKWYLSSFNKAFVGATGSQEQIDKLTQEMSVLYTKIIQKDDPEHYSIDHSGTIIIINPQGQFAGIFSMPHDAKKIASDVEILVKDKA